MCHYKGIEHLPRYKLLALLSSVKYIQGNIRRKNDKKITDLYLVCCIHNKNNNLQRIKVVDLERSKGSLFRLRKLDPNNNIISVYVFIDVII